MSGAHLSGVLEPVDVYMYFQSRIKFVRKKWNNQVRLMHETNFVKFLKSTTQRKESDVPQLRLVFLKEERFLV